MRHQLWTLNGLKKSLFQLFKNRGAAIIAARKLSSAASAASAICDHVHDWLVGTKPGQVVSMGVCSDGNTYGISSGLVYSFPVTCAGGAWKIVDGYKIDEYSQEKMNITEKELLEEKSQSLSN